MPFRFACALAGLLALSACSSDDDEAEAGRYAGIDHWECFEGIDCWCAGLTPGNHAASGDPAVDSCTFTTCYSYRPFGDSESWHCSCGPDGFMPEPGWEETEPVPACPPQ